MAITGPAITSAILAAGPTLQGPLWAKFAIAIGNAISQWILIPGNVQLTGGVTGTIGGGAVVGKMFLNPSPLPVSTTMTLAGFLGYKAIPVSIAIGTGVGTSLNSSAGYRGIATGAIGADISKVTFVNPASLSALIVTNLAALDIRGPLVSPISIGIGSGVAAMVAMGIGTGVAVGAAGPSPGAGVSRSSPF